MEMFGFFRLCYVLMAARIPRRLAIIIELFAKTTSPFRTFTEPEHRSWAVHVLVPGCILPYSTMNPPERDFECRLFLISPATKYGFGLEFRGLIVSKLR